MRKIKSLKAACNIWIWTPIEGSDANKTKFNYMHFLKTFVQRPDVRQRNILACKFHDDIVYWNPIHRLIPILWKKFSYFSMNHLGNADSELVHVFKSDFSNPSIKVTKQKGDKSVVVEEIFCLNVLTSFSNWNLSPALLIFVPLVSSSRILSQPFPLDFHSDFHILSPSSTSNCHHTVCDTEALGSLLSSSSKSCPDPCNYTHSFHFQNLLRFAVTFMSTTTDLQSQIFLFSIL